MAANLYKRCKCRDEAGREAGASCPRLRRADGSWNPRHGTWYYAVEMPPGPGGKRRARMRRGGYASRDEAERARDAAVAQLRHGADPSQRLTLGAYLTGWLDGRADLKPTTARAYRLAVTTYLVPLLGHIELAALRPADVAAAFATISEWNAALAGGSRVRPYQRPVGPAAMQRIRGVLRAALNDAMRGHPQLTDFNAAVPVRMPPERKWRPVAWTAQRVEAFWDAQQRLAAAMPGSPERRPFLAWRAMRLRPSPVMVWTPAQAGVFLDYAATHRLAPLFELIAATGIRRGEACGLRWPDVDLSRAVIHIRAERVQVGWAVTEGVPKSEAGTRPVALDKATVAVLEDWEATCRVAGFDPSGLVFTTPDGEPLHPGEVTQAFLDLAFAAGLPPVRLHDLRHGHASYALAAGVDVSVVRDRLGHSTSALTRDVYTTVLDEVAREAAETVAGVIPRAGQRGTDGLPWGSRRLPGGASTGPGAGADAGQGAGGVSR